MTASERQATIFITNYQYGRYLPDAVDSALAQTWPYVQVIVVDDGSTDESRLLLESYGDSIQTLFKDNGGQASCVNAGYSLITGEVVLFLDSDDMLDPTAIEKAIGFFDDPEVIKVSWPLAIVDAGGRPTGELRFRRLAIGRFQKRALQIGPASHYTPPTSANIWRTSFLDQVVPIPETDFRNIIDAYLFTFSPFFGTFQGIDEPLTFYRAHGSSISKGMTASVRADQWDARARHLHAWLTARGEHVSIEHWRRKNPYYRRLRGIVEGETRIGKLLPVDVPIVLIGDRLYDRSDIRPARPVYRPPDTIRSPERTESDFRAFIDEVRGMDVEHIAVQGPGTWSQTNLSVLSDLLHEEHQVLFENKWIVIARLLDAPPVPGSAPS